MVTAIVSALCAAEILTMSAFAMFPALQPLLRAEWGLSNTAAGWITGAYYLAYMLAVPVLTGLTDRVDARRVWLVAAAVAACAALGFGTIAKGFWSAFACQFAAGVSLAGTFMPGMKLLADRTEGPRQARYISFYTTSFTIGSSLSFYTVGALAEWLGWRTALVTLAAGPALAAMIVASTVPGGPSHAVTWDLLRGLHFGAVLRSAPAMRYIYAYMAHMWELFSMRAWLVPFLSFSQAMHGHTGLRPTTVAAMIALLGVPSSIAGNELAARLGRERVIPFVMAVALALSVLVGFSTPMPWTFVVLACAAYSVTINGDSAALTSGLVATAPPAVRGAAMAIHSMLGFAAAFGGGRCDEPREPGGPGEGARHSLEEARSVEQVDRVGEPERHRRHGHDRESDQQRRPHP